MSWAAKSVNLSSSSVCRCTNTIASVHDAVPSTGLPAPLIRGLMPKQWKCRRSRFDLWPTIRPNFPWQSDTYNETGSPGVSHLTGVSSYIVFVQELAMKAPELSVAVQPVGGTGRLNRLITRHNAMYRVLKVGSFNGEEPRERWSDEIRDYCDVGQPVFFSNRNGRLSGL
jgi:hypothetical protein